MNETRYSLCIAETDFNTNETRNKVCRVADFDFDNQWFIPAKYNDKDELATVENNNPRHLRAFANTLVAYRAEIRSWRTIVSSTHSFNGEPFINTESNSLGEYPIEILFLQQIDLDRHNSDASVRAILHNGISIPEYTSDSIFIILNKSNDTYEALLCKRRDFQITTNIDKYKIPKYCQDMLRTAHSLNMYTINLNDIFNTEHCTLYIDQGRKAPTRYFYKYLIEKRAERKFFLREPEDYAKAFISKYIKNKKDILKVSKADAQKWAIMIEDALTNKNELETFFDETGFKVSDVEYALKNLSDEIKELYLQDDNFSQIIERSLLKDPTVLELCICEAKKIWLLEQDTERDEIVTKTETYQNELQTVIEQKIGLEAELTQLSEKNKRLTHEFGELESKCESLEARNSKIQEDIHSELKHFQEDVVHLATIAGLITQKADVTSDCPSLVFSLPESDRKISDSNINEIDDFIDDLQDNLIAYGMTKKHSSDYSLLLTAVIMAKKQIIVCGSKADEIGNSLSLLINTTLARQVFLPVGYSDITKLISLINMSTSIVFVVHNALETFSDSIFLALTKYCKDKILVFSCESNETYRHLPQHWCNYAAFFYTDLAWSLPDDNDLHSGKYNILKLNRTFMTEKNEILTQVTKNNLCKPVYINNLIKVASIYKSLNNEADMTSFPLLCNICASICGDINQFFEIIEKTIVHDNVIQMLKDEFIYE